MNAITVKCPHCEKDLDHEGPRGSEVLCPHCGENFVVPLQVKIPKKGMSVPPAVVQCRECREEIRGDARRCKWCGSDQSAPDAVDVAVIEPPFTTLWTPIAMKLIYWSGAAIMSIILVCDAVLAALDGESTEASGLLLAVIVGNIFWRLSCEGAFILFAIYEQLVRLNRRR